MTDHVACVCGHKGPQRGAIGPQRIDDVAFVILPERSAIDAANMAISAGVSDRISIMPSLSTDEMALGRGGLMLDRGCAAERRRLQRLDGPRD